MALLDVESRVAGGQGFRTWRSASRKCREFTPGQVPHQGGPRRALEIDSGGADALVLRQQTRSAAELDPSHARRRMLLAGCSGAGKTTTVANWRALLRSGTTSRY